MKITKLILAVYLVMGMAACDTDKDIAVYSEDSGAIQIEAAINTVFTRSNPGATGDQQKQFNEGDEIQLSCEDGYLNYVLSEGFKGEFAIFLSIFTIFAVTLQTLA